MYLHMAMLFTLYGCNFFSHNNVNNEVSRQDSISIDSLRQAKCDSLLKSIIETGSEQVKLPGSIPKNIGECIVQLDTCTNHRIKEWIICVTEDEYTSFLHHGFGTYLRNTWGLWGGSDLVLYFNSLGIFHPDDMSGLILECFHQYINTGKYSIDEKIERYKAYWKNIKEREDSVNKINTKQYEITKRFVDSLHQAIKYEECFQKIKGLVKDSLNFYIEETKGDTVLLWTSAGSGSFSCKEYKKMTEWPHFGKTSFFGHISREGDIICHSLSLQRFIRKKGYLYYEEESGDFVKVFTPEMAKNPAKTNEWIPVNNCSFNKSFVKIIWELEGKKYYYIEMNGDCEGTGLAVRYFIDEHLNIIFDEHLRKKLWKSIRLFDTDA